MLRKAANDYAAAGIGLLHAAPLDTTCFHIQQTAEKALKACLASASIEYPFSHDLRELLSLAVQHFPQLEPYRDSVPEYTEFAVGLRYDDLPLLTEAEAVAAHKIVGKLVETVQRLVAGVAS